MASRIHKGVLYGGAALIGFGLVTSSLIGFAGSSIWDMIAGEEEEVAKPAPEAFDIKIGDEPKPKKEPKPEDEPKTLAQTVKENRKEERRTQRQEKPKKTLTERWLEEANNGELYTFGEATGNREGSLSVDGDCSILQPIRVRAMIADNATTDQPGLAIGQVTEDIQGNRDDGSWCVAIHGGAVVGFMVSQAGEYATNRAPVQTEAIWLSDGHKIEVGQPAKYIDGIPGVVGKANHHVWSKTFATIGAIAFRGFDNVTSIGQFSTGGATDPIEDALAKRFNRPSEISFKSGKTVEFDVMPTSTPGYD